MPTLMPCSKGHDNKTALIYAPGDPRAEPQGVTARTGIVRPSQGANASDTLTRNYTYVYLDLVASTPPRRSRAVSCAPTIGTASPSPASPQPGGAGRTRSRRAVPPFLTTSWSNIE
eukprot:8532469-Pyramimonas_sp.AAC.1